MSFFLINEITASDAGPDIIRSHLLTHIETSRIFYSKSRVNREDYYGVFKIFYRSESILFLIKKI